jgi:hypothetical protein
VDPGSARADEERCGDLAIGVALAQQREHRLLALGEKVGQRVAPRRGLGA